MKRLLLIWCALVFALSVQVAMAEADDSGFVKRNGTHFELDGHPFYFASANNYYLFYKSHDMIDEVLEDARGLGLKVMRTWGSCEGILKDGFCFQLEPGVYDEDTFRQMDYIIKKAGECGLRLIIPLVNNWDDTFGGMEQYARWSATAKASLLFDLYNAGSATHVNIAVSTGDNWTWHESIYVPISTGWNTVSFNLNSSNWKKAPDWTFTHTISDLDDVKRLSIGIYGYSGTGSVYIDNMRLGPQGNAIIWDRLEYTGGWFASDTWSDTTGISSSQSYVSEGGYALKLDYDTSKAYGKAFMELDTRMGNHDTFYIDDYCRTLYENYIEEFLTRQNYYTGVVYKDDPTIMMWELANELRCETDPSGATLQGWIEDMAAYIKELDPKHLVSTGGEGLYNQSGSNYIANNQCEDIDASSFHMFPNDNILSDEDAKKWIEDHIRDAHDTIGKPAYLGEFGWKVERVNGSYGELVLHDFADAGNVEGWQVHWGYPSDPVQAASPSSNDNGSLQYACSFAPGTAETAGGRVWYAAPLDISAYEYISAFVRTPNAPDGTWLELQLYSVSGQTNSETWSSTPVKGFLLPERWYLVKMAVSEIPYPAGVKSIGIQVKSFNSTYTGQVYYDQIEAFSGTAVRDRVYKEWCDLVYNKGGDGAGFWDLCGHQDDGSIYPDYYHYTVYYPEDTQTCDVIQEFAGQMNAASLGAAPFIAANLDNDGLDDLVIDFGPEHGIWIRDGNNNWTQLHNLSPESITAANIDADDEDELAIDFGSQYGIWIRDDNNNWTQLHNLSPDSIVAGDLDNNGQDDLAIDFGSQYGIWIYYNNSTWQQLHNLSAESIGTAHGNGVTILSIDFGPDYGIWNWYPPTGNWPVTWQQLHNLSPDSGVAADIDNDGFDEGVIDFGSSYGIWIFDPNQDTWTQLHNISPESITAGNIDSDPKEDLIIDFGSQYGIWVYANNSTWSQLHNLNPDYITTGNLDQDNIDEVIIDFGAQYGIWVYNDGSWTQLHNLSP